MRMVTKTLNTYEVTAYDLVDDRDNGLPEVAVVARTLVTLTGITKSTARSALAREVGHPLPKGLAVRWEPVGSVTYGMPLDEYLEHAEIISIRDLE